MSDDGRRLEDLEAAFAQMQVPVIFSVDDLARVEAERASRHFGFSPPVANVALMESLARAWRRGYADRGSGNLERHMNPYTDDDV